MRLAVCLGLGVLTLAAVASSRHALACDLADNTFRIDGDGSGAAPGPVGNLSAEITRAQDDGGCGGGVESSCGDLGTIAIHFTPAMDADNPPDEVGYRLDLVGGNPPFALATIIDPQSAFPDGDRSTIFLHFGDDNNGEQPAFAFSVTLTPIDRNGNVGPTSEPLGVRHNGDSGCGCRMGTGSGSLELGALALVAASLLRRRQR